MKSKSRNVWKKRILKWCVFLGIVFFVLDYSYYRIVPRLQDEYTRAGLSEDMQAVFDEYRQPIPKMMAENDIPGLSIAIVDREGILWTAGFGYTDYDRKTPVTPETIFNIQSMSKTFTATAVMFAVQDGLVELDVPITKYLPDFTVNSRFEENPQDKISLRHLLTHTAGFAHEAPIGNNKDPRYTCFEEHVKSISDTWLKHKVGERHSYSNLGIDLAAYILQVKSGKPFAEYVKEKLLEPLGMPNSSADMEFIKRHPNRAIGHWPHVKKVPVEIPMIGGSGVYTNAKELAKFIQFHLNRGKVNGRRVLEERLIETMYTPQSENTGYGLGIRIWRDNEGDYRLGHDGSGFGFFSHMSWLPEYGIGGLCLGNSNSVLQLRGDIFRQLINEKLIEKCESSDNRPWRKVWGDNSEGGLSQRPDSDPFTRYQPAWKKYIGTYRYMMSGWKPRTYVKIVMALGYPVSELQAKVYEKNGFLEIDGERLDEYLPGLFFTDDGECLDFRGSIPTWQNFRMKKIK